MTLFNTDSAPAARYRYPRVLSIAGSDSSGGAGIQADLKTFSALGCYGMTAITALTAQNTLGVRAIHGVPPEMLVHQIDAVVEDIGVDAVKIGMLHSSGVARAVAQAIARHGLKCVVFDPVMVATSGAMLVDEAAIGVMVDEVFPRADLITPNLDEAALLVGYGLQSEADMERAANRLLDMGARSVLLKGGHLQSDVVTDVLLQGSGDRQCIWMRAPRIPTSNTHGTGCTLSSAIAAGLALGQPLAQAVLNARIYIRGALEAGAAVTTGKGSGPLNHGYAPVAMLHWPEN